MKFPTWIKVFLFCLVVATAAYAEDSDSKKQIDFEGDVVEGVNKQPLDSLNQISNGDNGSNRLHRYRRLNRGLDQVGMKGLERDPVAGRTFWKHRKNVARAKALCHLQHDPVRVSPRLTLNIQGTGTTRQRTYKKPTFDIGLGDKPAMAR